MINIGTNKSKQISFDLPTLIESRLLIQANSGGGKSYAIRRLLEQSHGKVQHIVLDVEGEFSSLREKYDYVIAGKGADTPVQSKSAGLLARKLLELRCSAVCDLYELPKHERIRFVRLFLESLMTAPKKFWKPTLIVIDEANIFCPQTDKAESGPAVIDLVARGRKRGYCGVLATQRLSKLNKDACAETLNKMVGRVSLDIDQKRARDELGMANNAETSSALRSLNPGEFFCFGPALHVGKKQFSGVTQLKVGSVRSHHPKVGSRQVEAPPAPTGKIKKILGELANLPEAAEKKAKDMAQLKTELITTKRALTLAQKQQPKCECDKAIRLLENQIRDLLTESGRVTKSVTKTVNKIRSEIDELENLSNTSFILKKIPASPPLRPAYKVTKGVLPITKPQSGVFANNGNGDVTSSQMRILQSLAAFEPVGLTQLSKATLAAHAGFSHKSGGYANNLSRLNTIGLITYPIAGHASLTDQGREMAGDVDPIESLSELHQSWLRLIKSASRQRILTIRIEIYPDDIAKLELADHLGVSGTSGGYANNLSALRSIGAADYPSSGRIKATDLLFPEELI